MSEPADILEAARSIRPYLSELLPAAEAEVIDQQLADLLAQANTTQRIDNLILELLAAQDVTREWIFRFLQDKQQPEHLGTFHALPDPRGMNALLDSGNFSDLPGSPSIVNTTKFVCPEGDYTWYRPRVGVKPPLCPTHHLRLKLAPEKV
ncbi:MAG: hypothetical protein ACSI46_17155 [Gloeotrichia echinulata DVL01]|jgi:hypothetical protein